MADVLVPTSIPTSAPGAPFARSVTADLQTFFDGIDKNVGVRVLFQPNRVYRIEKPVTLTNNKNLWLEGQGATAQATVTAIYSAGVGTNGTVTGCVIGGQKWVYGAGGATTIKTITAPAGTTPFGPIAATYFQSWYVAGTSSPAIVRTQGAKDMSTLPGPPPNVPAPTSSVIHIINATADIPADGTYTLKFTSPDDRNRAQFIFANCDDVIVNNLHVVGANPTWAGFKNEYEQQSCLWFQGGCDGINVANCEIDHPWGDCISLQCGSGVPIKNVHIHDNELHHSTRQTMTTNGVIDAVIENNNMHDGHRHIIDMEPNGGNQTCQRITFQNNKMDRGNFGAIAISAYGSLPMFIGDIVFDNNTIDGQLNIPVGTNHDKPATQPRWGPFTFTNNTATLGFGTGGSGGPWSNAPALIKFQYCDGIIVHNNVCKLQTGRLMYAVWAEHCTGIDVSGNHDQTASDTFVTPHHELFTDQVAGQAIFTGGGSFTAVGASVPSTVGSMQFTGGGSFTAVGHGVNHGLATLSGGGTFTAVGHSVSRGTASFAGGGAFTATGIGTNFGKASFDAGGTFTASGHGRNFGVAAFDGGGDFSAVGKGRNFGVAAFDAGGTFTVVGLGQSHGRASFAGGGEFDAVGHGRNFGVAVFDGGGEFTAVGSTPIFGTAVFDGGGTFIARGHTNDDEDREDGRWLAGAVALRGPGWDESGWDTDPWGGLG